MLSINEIEQILPQRYPFLMIDRVQELDPGQRIVACKNVSYNENYFPAHFPGNPVMPGALIIEAMAQAGIILLYSKNKSDSGKKTLFFLGAVKIRFHSPVTPGDQLKIIVEPIKVIAQAGIVKAQAYVGDREVASGEISFVAKD